MDKWTTTKSESLVDNHWVKIRKDSVVLPNEQKIDDFYVITINNAAAIVAIDEDGNCILKKEYRYCYDRDLIEVPAGTFEEDETDGLAVAKRELLEETGYKSDEWQYLGATVESSAKLLTICIFILQIIVRRLVSSILMRRKMWRLLWFRLKRQLRWL